MFERFLVEIRMPEWLNFVRMDEENRLICEIEVLETSTVVRGKDVLPVVEVQGWDPWMPEQERDELLRELQSIVLERCIRVAFKNQPIRISRSEEQPAPPPMGWRRHGA